jgi:hypothetical protein
MRQILMMAALLIGCGQNTTGLQLGDNVDVKYGATLVVPGDTTSVRFTDVTSDSRCPSGAQCVWAGEATVLLTVGGTQAVSLTLGADSSKATATVRMTRITLVALKPYPSLNAPIAKSSYVASLRFGSTKD